jgi:cytochrome c553
VNRFRRLHSAAFAAVFVVAAFFAFYFAFLAAPARAAGDVEAKTQVCSACHGQNGAPSGPAIPIIWGQQQNYLFKELHDYHSGDRKNPIMAPLVESDALPDLRAIAVYFAAKTWPARQTADAPAAPPDAIAGKIAMCKACHGPNFEGGAPAPRLAGLSADYLAASMRSFADGERTNNGDMPKFMKVLSDGDRDAIAKYLAGL